MTFPVQDVLQEVRKRVVGQDIMVERLLIGLLTGGHVLLEGVPGLAKTLTVKTLADVLHASFSRIQFTPDLLPADVVGTMIFDTQSQGFTARRGPIFAQIVLALGVVALLAERIPSWVGSEDHIHQLEEELAARRSTQE